MKAGLVLLLEEVHVLCAVLQNVAHAVLEVCLHGSAGRAHSSQHCFDLVLITVGCCVNSPAAPCLGTALLPVCSANQWHLQLQATLLHEVPSQLGASCPASFWCHCACKIPHSPLHRPCRLPGPQRPSRAQSSRTLPGGELCCCSQPGMWDLHTASCAESARRKGITRKEKKKVELQNP